MKVGDVRAHRGGTLYLLAAERRHGVGDVGFGVLVLWVAPLHPRAYGDEGGAFKPNVGRGWLCAYTKPWDAP